MGRSKSEFAPATTTTKSHALCRSRIAPARKLCPAYSSSALSCPMREDAPAASTTPANAGERGMKSRLQGTGYREQAKTTRRPAPDVHGFRNFQFRNFAIGLSITKLRNYQITKFARVLGFR